MCGARPSLSVWDGVAFVVGVVVGTGIFKTPSLVAAEAGSISGSMLVWVIGALASLIGALCYAELASTYPNVGGDYHYIDRAYGAAPAALFAWSRLLVLQSGSIAMQAFVVGDYASELARLGGHSAAIYAAAVVALVTLANVAGLRQGRGIQRVLTVALIAGLLAMIATGLLGPAAPPEAAPPTGGGGSGSVAGLGMALIFVLLTYGGWNEAVYLSAELDVKDGRARGAEARRPQGGEPSIRRGVSGGSPPDVEARRSHRPMVRVLLGALAVIALLYFAANAAFFHALGWSRVASSEAVGATLMHQVLGPYGAKGLSVLVVVAALSTVNATMFTGARSTYALGCACTPLRFLGRWEAAAGSPRRAMLTQGAISLALVTLGALTRDGFRTMVEYTAPVFWFFLLIGVVSLPILRRKDPDVPRPFRVPLYPWTPLAFAGVAIAMLYSSIAYAGWGALVGVGVVLAGVPLLIGRRSTGQHQAPGGETDEAPMARADHVRIPDFDGDRRRSPG
jgi:amino acid transporter